MKEQFNYDVITPHLSIFPPVLLLFLFHHFPYDKASFYLIMTHIKINRLLRQHSLPPKFPPRDFKASHRVHSLPVTECVLIVFCLIFHRHRPPAISTLQYRPFPKGPEQQLITGWVVQCVVLSLSNLIIAHVIQVLRQIHRNPKWSEKV